MDKAALLQLATKLSGTNLWGSTSGRRRLRIRTWFRTVAFSLPLDPTWHRDASAAATYLFAGERPPGIRPVCRAARAGPGSGLSIGSDRDAARPATRVVRLRSAGSLAAVDTVAGRRAGRQHRGTPLAGDSRALRRTDVSLRAATDSTIRVSPAGVGFPREGGPMSDRGLRHAGEGGPGCAAVAGRVA